LLVVVVGRGRVPGMVPLVAVVVIAAAATCRRAAVVVKVMVKGEIMICTQTWFPDPG